MADNQAVPGTAEGQAETQQAVQPSGTVTPDSGTQAVSQTGSQPQGQAGQPTQFDVESFVQERLSKPAEEWDIPPEHAPKVFEHLRTGNLRQSDYSRRMNELTEAQKKLWNPSSKTFTAEDLATLGSNQSFMTVVNQYLEQQQAQAQAGDLTEEQRRLYEAGQQINRQKQELEQVKQFQYQQQLDIALSNLDGDQRFSSFKKKPSAMKDEIEWLRREAANPQKPLSPEGAYRALYFDQAVKEAEDRGFQRGLGARNQKINSQPINGLQTSGVQTAQPSTWKGAREAVASDLRAKL